MVSFFFFDVNAFSCLCGLNPFEGIFLCRQVVSLKGWNEEYYAFISPFNRPLKSRNYFLFKQQIDA